MSKMWGYSLLGLPKVPSNPTAAIKKGAEDRWVWVAENEVRYEQEKAWDIKKRCFCRCRPSEGTPNP